MDKYVIITAGGQGLRMGAAVPKQFLPLAGEPILAHTLRAFASWGKLLLVLPAEQMQVWREMSATLRHLPQHNLLPGGSERFFSVQNGLCFVPEGSLVAVHDGVRPLVSQEVIRAAFAKAEETGAAIPVLPLADSLRRQIGQGSVAVNRAEYFRVQTPQVFDSTRLKTAYEQSYCPAFTDDASVYESLGYSVSLTEGNPENVKITTPVDLKWAETLLAWTAQKPT